MSSLTFTDDMANIQRSVAQCQDQVYRRGLMLSAMQFKTGDRVLEIGCGGGFYAYEAAQCVGSNGCVCAIDHSEDQIITAQNHCNDMAWVDCRVGDATALPYAPSSFDSAYGIQVFEYVDQLDTALHEVQRVLRTGGKFFILSTDWRTAVWHSEKPERMQRILTVWENHSSTYNLPSIIGGKLKSAGLEPTRQTPMTFLNRSYHKNSFSYWAARVIHPFVKSKQGVSAEDVDAWFDEFDFLEKQHAYFFCLTSILTEAVKVKL